MVDHRIAKALTTAEDPLVSAVAQIGLGALSGQVEHGIMGPPGTGKTYLGLLLTLLYLSFTDGQVVGIASQQHAAANG